MEISIIMPVFNASQYIAECIESILSQSFKDFEIIVVNDGSTDNTTDVVKSFHEKKILLLNNIHDYIGSLNMGINAARGKYIARMDGDDIMMPERLQIQYDFMENHPEIDLVCGGFVSFDQHGERRIYRATGQVTAEQMLNGNKITHGCVMARSEFYKKYTYSADYVYAEDYELWLRMINDGGVLWNLPEIMIRYRQHDKQTTILRYNEMVQATENAIERYGGGLSIIIPFLNEKTGYIEMTVDSIKNTTTTKPEIILINDNSENPNRYYYLNKKYGVKILHNKYRIGVAAARDFGVRIAKKPYILLLDAHMKFYEKGWDERILSLLKKHPEGIICGDTLSLIDEDGKIKESKKQNTCGAYINMQEDEWLFTTKWNYSNDSRLLVEVPAPLGAAYAFSRDWWNTIGGLRGLRSYGYDETLMAVKTWLCGGKVFLDKTWLCGHVYRKKSPYPAIEVDYLYNRFFLCELFLCENEKRRVYEANAAKYPKIFADVVELINKNKKPINDHKNELEKVFKYDFDYFLNINNNINNLK